MMSRTANALQLQSIFFKHNTICKIRIADNEHRIQKYVTLNSKEPLFFGNLHEVLQRGAEATSKNQGKVTGKITFLKENPGRQMIGSFNPITEDDW